MKRSLRTRGREGRGSVLLLLMKHICLEVLGKGASSGTTGCTSWRLVESVLVILLLKGIAEGLWD